MGPTGVQCVWVLRCAALRRAAFDWSLGWHVSSRLIYGQAWRAHTHKTCTICLA